MRINKYLNGAGVSSRREADRFIEAGRVAINGRVARLGDRVEAGDTVTLDGKKVVPPTSRAVIAFHKPVGVIVTTDERSPDNVMQALHASGKPLPKARLFPVGRLDVASSGLLLFTDDTALADRLMKPDSGVEKEYDVTVNDELRPDALEHLRTGIAILGRVTKPATVAQIDRTRFRIVLTEGKNRQIRRMCEALGYAVLKLVRVRVGGVELGNLAEGDWRPLTEHERNTLRSRD